MNTARRLFCAGLAIVAMNVAYANDTRSVPGAAALATDTRARLEPDARVALDAAWAYYQESIAKGLDAGLAAGRWGMALQAHRLEADAIAAYRIAAAALPEDPRWPFYIGAEHEEQGRLAEAAAAYRQSAALAPERARTWSRLGRVYYESGLTAEAQQAFSRALELDARLAHAHAGLGDLAVLAGADETALEHYERALALQPEALRLHYRIAQAARRLGDTERARAHLGRYGERDVRLADPWLDAMRLLAGDAAGYLDAGLEAARAGDAAQAETLLRTALHIEPDNLDALVTLADALRLQNRVEQGLAMVARARALQPGHAGALVVEGLLLRDAGRADAAVTALLAASRAAPGDTATQALVAETLFELGRFARAADFYAQALAHGAVDAALEFRYGIALHASGRCAEALAKLSAVAGRARSSEVVAAYGRVAAFCPQAGERERRAALGALEAYPGQAEISETRAMLLAASGQWDDAVKLQQRLVDEAGATDALRGFRRRNLERYRDHEPAIAAWPPGHPYSPR